MTVREYVLNEIQKKYTIEDMQHIDELNYVESGYIDSLGIIQFIVGIEEEFGIEFSDEEIAKPEFRVVGKLIEIIEGKVRSNEES
ncbi:MAG: acyl carrier protein [Cellulosilyticum sp.]|nr:acyl carrier protein [Cellulosilyticum sp.]